MSKVCNLAHAFAHILHFCVRILFVATIFDYDKNIKKFARVVFFNRKVKRNYQNTSVNKVKTFTKHLTIYLFNSLN